MNLFSKSSAAGLVYAATAAIAPTLLFFVPRSTTALAIATALAGLGFAMWRREWPRAMDKPFAHLFAGLCIWAALTIAWSPDTYLAARGVLKLTGNLLLGALLFGIARRLVETERRLVERALIGGFAVGLGLVTLEWLSDGAILRFFRGQPRSHTDVAFLLQLYGFFWLNACVALIIVFLWPVAMALRRAGKTYLAALLFPIVALVGHGLGYTTSTLALFSGVLVAAFVYVFRRRAGMVVIAVLVAGVMAAPLLPITVLKPSTDVSFTDRFSLAIVHRLFIWEFAAKRIAEHPLRGWGMNASRVIPGGKTPVVVQVRYPGEVRTHGLGHTMPLHPHNLPLQIWLELGFPGVVLFGILLLLPLRLTRPGFGREESAIACGQFAATFVVSSFSYGAWQSWWLAVLWLGASFTAIVCRPPSDG